jgi:exodeoxyribonuclease-3|tara:strand:+ start:437 stop:1207 length:771 start_codon:yes stop_codon:yes gene_type:complete
MKLFSWNVNGVRAIEKKGFLDWMSSELPDVLCIQETKAKFEQLPDTLQNIDGYYSYWHSADKLGYSGVATFCREEPLHVQYGLGIEKYDQEGRVLITEFENFLLYNIYFPNGQKDEFRLQYKLDFYDDLLAILDDQVESGNNVIVAGDWNTAHQPIDLANPKANEKYSGFLPVERAQLDEYVEHGYVDSFRLFHDEPNRYSWWTYRYGARERNIGWRIDYFFTNQEFANQIANADIHENVMGSDHCPISLELSDNF